jgi:hypothetical protein
MLQVNLHFNLIPIKHRPSCLNNIEFADRSNPQPQHTFISIHHSFEVVGGTEQYYRNQLLDAASDHSSEVVFEWSENVC